MLTSTELTHYDLVTPDGKLIELKRIDPSTANATIFIENISPNFVGFEIDSKLTFFNIKSTLAQLGLDGFGTEYDLDKNRSCAQVKIELLARGALARSLLDLIPLGAYLGKLFAADDRRIVRNPDYLSRMFGRSDRNGSPLLSLGGLHGGKDLILEKVDGRTIAYLSLRNGKVEFDSTIEGALPAISKALSTRLSVREWVQLHHDWKPSIPRHVSEDEILLVKTLPLHIRTVFGHVVNPLLSEGYHHTSASVLQPDTSASGDIYELFGESKREISDIPLEFYTLEPYREHVFFQDRDQLQSCIEKEQALFDAFDTAPKDLSKRAVVFVVKGDQLLALRPKDWNTRETFFQEFPGTAQSERQALMVKRYIEQQAGFPFLKAISEGVITSQGILLTRHLPSPLMKRMFISDQVQQCLKGIYFRYPSLHNDLFFSAEDRALLNDLSSFGVPAFWVDDQTKRILQYVKRGKTDSGMFVPLDKVETFENASFFGVYGSNLLEGDFEAEIKELLSEILKMQKNMNHELLGLDTPLALVTGGGPGVMEMGNRVAKELGILSCANIMDFRVKGEAVVNEQKQNPYVEAKMTYRLDKLVERQAEFHLDFPIFLVGGIGTDFEYSLEEVRRKVGSTLLTPVILFGSPKYWKEKITSRFICNKNSGTITGSEWLSNCFYCIENAKEGLLVYQKFFNKDLSMGPDGPIYEEGFVVVAKDLI